MMRLPSHGDCFLCGSTASPGVGLALHGDRDSVSAQLALDERAQGAPGFVHGGALAAILDEAMTAACWARGRKVMVARLEVDYRQPVPLGAQLVLEARCVEEIGRRCSAVGQIRLLGGLVACVGRSTLVAVSARFPP